MRIFKKNCHIQIVIFQIWQVPKAEILENGKCNINPTISKLQKNENFHISENKKKCHIADSHILKIVKIFVILKLSKNWDFLQIVIFSKKFCEFSYMIKKTNVAQLDLREVRPLMNIYYIIIIIRFYSTIDHWSIKQLFLIWENLLQILYENFL